MEKIKNAVSKLPERPKKRKRNYLTKEAEDILEERQDKIEEGDLQGFLDKTKQFQKQKQKDKGKKL